MINVNKELKTRKMKVKINGEERIIITKEVKANDNKIYTYYATLSKKDDDYNEDFYKNKYLKLREKMRRERFNRLKEQLKEIRIS